MKRNLHAKAFFDWGTWCAILWTLTLHAQVPLRWTAESSRQTATTFTAYRGETLLLQPTITAYGAVVSNITATSLLWQTNGMGRSWWQTNVLRWTPDMDVGASSYTLFIRAESSNGVNYSANAVLRMLNSPGHTPNALPLPASRIDFATLIVTNAPWLHPDDLANYYTKAQTDTTLAGKASTQSVESAIATLDTNVASRTAAALATQKVTRVYNPTNVNLFSVINGRAVEVYEITSTPKRKLQYSMYAEVVQESAPFDAPSQLYEGWTSPTWQSSVIGDVTITADYDDFYSERVRVSATGSQFTPDTTSGWGAVVYRWQDDFSSIAWLEMVIDNSVAPTLATNLIMTIDLDPTQRIDDHNSDASAHPSIQSKLYALPIQPSLTLTNHYSTNINSRLVISASNGVLRVQEIIP